MRGADGETWGLAMRRLARVRKKAKLGPADAIQGSLDELVNSR